MAADNTIFIGNKPFMNYVTGVVMQFTTKNENEVLVKARGKFISRAVDVAEVAAKRFLNGQVDIKGVKIDSEEFEKELKRMQSKSLSLLIWEAIKLKFKRIWKQY